MSQDRSDDVAPETGDDAADDSVASTTGTASPAGSSAVSTEKGGAPTSTRRGRRDEATEAAMPTGKAGRGNTAVAERVRTDADEPEDTRTRRANPIQYLQQVVEELRKVIWPTKGQMLTYTIVVFLFLVFMTALVSGADYGAGKLVELVFDRK